MTRYARRFASPEFLAITPNNTAPNRNHAVVSAKPANATGNGATPSAQNRKQPIKPVSAWSSATVIQATTMNAVIASACWMGAASPSGTTQRTSATAAAAARRPRPGASREDAASAVISGIFGRSNRRRGPIGGQAAGGPAASYGKFA